MAKKKHRRCRTSSNEKKSSDKQNLWKKICLKHRIYDMRSQTNMFIFYVMKTKRLFRVW